MIKSRHHAREIALQILYQYDLTPPPESSQDQALISELTQHYSHFHVPVELQEFVGQLVVGTLKNIKDLDLLLEKHASHWKIPRMSVIDRSLLRMAIYEMVHLLDTPPSVVIDEAIELAKQFGTSESPAFINGILDGIRVSVKNST
jgi:transcription antitermination protein NusB